jgi:hypothetical protein
MPARPAIRSSSVSSIGSSDSSFSAMSASRAAALGYGPGSSAFKRSGSGISSGGGGSGGGGGGSVAAAPRGSSIYGAVDSGGLAQQGLGPMRLTMESLRSMSPPAGGVVTDVGLPAYLLTFCQFYDCSLARLLSEQCLDLETEIVLLLCALCGENSSHRASKLRIVLPHLMQPRRRRATTPS